MREMIRFCEYRRLASWDMAVGPCDCTEATAKPRRIVEMVMQSFIYLWPSPKESRKAVTKL
jgi:hypothetical protein